MKKIILLSIVLATSNLFAEGTTINSVAGTVNQSATATSVGAHTMTPAPAVETQQRAAVEAVASIVASAPKKHLSLKQKVQELWSKIANYDYASLNILKKVEQFALGKKKQNSEAMDGAETGEWKHTKRMPTSGTTKVVADKLDKAQQEILKKVENIN